MRVKIGICLSLAWKLILLTGAEAHGAEREQWTGHSVHEMVQAETKDFASPQVFAFALGLPVETDKNCLSQKKSFVFFFFFKKKAEVSSPERGLGARGKSVKGIGCDFELDLFEV